MMEKAIKQRLLGGLVLVAGAALFLPVLLDGSGAALTIPPMPRAPEVGGVEALAPRLDQKVAEAEQAVDVAHAGRDEATPEAGAAPVGEGAGDVAPDAAALAADEARAAAATVMPTPAQAVKPATAVAAPAAATAAAKPAAPVKPAPVVGATATPAPAKPAAAAAAPAKPVVASPAPAPARPVVAPPAPAKAPAETAVKPATDKALPGAWLVQVGVFSSREKAQGLVQQLRRKGYAAVLSPQGGSFKVVVGPELNRSVADSIKSRLAADPELKLNGWVQAYKP